MILIMLFIDSRMSKFVCTLSAIEDNKKKIFQKTNHHEYLKMASVIIGVRLVVV